MNKEKLRLLVLCTGNSARSIMAEAIFNSLGGQFFEAQSAGSRPTGEVNPLALEQINHLSDPLPEPHSKSWQLFAEPEQHAFDVILTVCDHAAQEVCPLFPGDWFQVHWGLPDPADKAYDRSRARTEFRETFAILSRRVAELVKRAQDQPTKDQLIKAMRELAEQN